jgi:hypothetical protein
MRLLRTLVADEVVRVVGSRALGHPLAVMIVPLARADAAR